jgi:hypothetical protein
MKFFLKLTKKVSLIILKQKKSRINFQRNILNDINRRLTEKEAIREFTLKNIYGQRLIFLIIKNMNIPIKKL